jgi:hypothetical protein
MADFIIEPKVGGRWCEVGVDGKEYETGTHYRVGYPLAIAGERATRPTAL